MTSEPVPQAPQQWQFEVVSGATAQDMTALINTRAALGWEPIQCWCVAYTYLPLLHYCLMRLPK